MLRRDQPARSRWRHRRSDRRRRPVGAAAAGPRRTSTPPHRGPSTTATRSAPGSTHRASPSPRRPLHGPRRCSTGRSTGSRSKPPGASYVATENDTIYALAANTGAVLWSSHVGTPVPSGDLPCGDISPTVGITGTPVLDVARGEIFAVADELNGSTPAHVLVGLNMYTGTTLLDEDVDPPGQTHVGDPAAHRLEPQQRQRGLRLRRQRRRLLDLQRLGRARRPRAAGPRVTTRRCRSATTGPCGWEAPLPRSTGRATSGSPRGTGRRRLRTTSATRSCNCRRAWLAPSTSPRATGPS